VVETGALLPDPIYLLIPIGSNVGSLIWAVVKRIDDPDSDWGENIAVGYVVGGLFGALIVLLLIVAGVD